VTEVSIKSDPAGIVAKYGCVLGFSGTSFFLIL